MKWDQAGILSSFLSFMAGSSLLIMPAKERKGRKVMQPPHKIRPAAAS